LQSYAVWRPNHRDNIEKNKPQWVRYFEYSISASCMMIAIAISFGLLDIYLHLCIFILTFLCMVMGLVADVVRDIAAGPGHNEQLVDLMMKVHYISWIPMIIPWIILIAVACDLQNDTFAELCTTPSADSGGREMPWFVWLVVVLEFTLFSVFGYVQRWQFYQEYEMEWGRVAKKKPICSSTESPSQPGCYNAKITGLRTELYFICLSLSAKSMLGWIIYSQVLLQPSYYNNVFE
jgi:hypothetical protein